MATPVPTPQWAGPTDLAVDQCGAWIGDEPVKGDGSAANLLALLPEYPGWRVRIPREDPRTVVFRLAFSRPVPVGSIHVAAPAGRVSVLKPDATFPGDVHDADPWDDVPIRPGHGAGVLATLDAVREVRAVRIELARGQRTLYGVRLLGQRWHNLTPYSRAYGEWTRPYGDPADNVPDGGTWANTGKGPEGRFMRPPLSDVEPSWFMLTWDHPQAVTALWLTGDVRRFEAQYYAGPAEINPRAGTESEWRKLNDVKALTPLSHAGQWFSLPGVSSHGLRLRISAGDERAAPVARITGIHALVPLGDAPLPPAPRRDGRGPELPVAIPLDFPAAGLASVVINDPQGRRVRNLFARRQRPAGTGPEPWDLLDENGNFAPAGTYSWQALWHPGITRRYLATLYPNVTQFTDQRAPWLTDRQGADGWLADHGVNSSLCLAGDFIYLGSGVCESGVQLLKADLDGVKQWGQGNWMRFTGTHHLASDGVTAFSIGKLHNAADPAAGIDPRAEGIWAINVASDEVAEPVILNPTADRMRGTVSAAARDGLLYLAINADEDYLAQAVKPADADIARTTPRYPPTRDPRFPYEVVPDNRGDFLRLFRLTGDPPGYGHRAGGLIQLESTRGPGPRQHIVLPFLQHVAIGSVVFPVPHDRTTRVRLSVARPDAPYPPDPDRHDLWIPFTDHGQSNFDVATAPPGTVTRALRISFVKGEDDIFTQGPTPAARKPKGGGSMPSLDGALDGDLDTGSALHAGGPAWEGRIEGAMILRRRFTNAARDAKRLFDRGNYDPVTDTWDAQRPADRPITEADPARFGLAWQQPQSVRGLALKEIDAARTLIDVWTGAGEPDLHADAHWRQVAEYQQKRRRLHPNMASHNAHARYMDGYVDFGQSIDTRGVRLRLVEQWRDNGRTGDYGVRDDREGTTLEPHRARVYGLAAMHYEGGEDPVDPRIAQRIEVYDPRQRKIVREIGFDHCETLAVRPDGNLMARRGKTLIEVHADATEPHTQALDIENPGTFCYGADGLLYVFDTVRQVFVVYDPAGRRLKELGTSGGIQPGSWDPSRFGKVVACAVDGRGQLWAAEGQYWPKRLVVWDARAGAFRREHLGNTEYGGGGAIDRENPTRVVYGPLEFEVDYASGRSRIRNFLGDGMPESFPLRYQGRLYFVSRPPLSSPNQGAAEVWLYDESAGRAAPVAAVGWAHAFKPLQRPELHQALGMPDLKANHFIWADRNGDHDIQPDEITLDAVPGMAPGGRMAVLQFEYDLSINVMVKGWRYVVKQVLPNGAPQYELVQAANNPGGATYAISEGRAHHMGDGGAPERGLMPDGQTWWTYPAEAQSVGGLRHAKPFRPDQVVSQMARVGHEAIHAGDLGELLVLNANHGGWSMWTADGILAGWLFEDLRAPGVQRWAMPEHQRGMDLGRLALAQEHFSGWFCRTPDNRYLAVAGHNHLSIVQIEGLDRFQRFRGTIEVTPDLLRQTMDAVRQYEARQSYERAAVMAIPRLTAGPAVDGDLSDLPGPIAEFGDYNPNRGDIEYGALLYAGYNDTMLFLGFDVRGLGPMKNAGGPMQELFKTGAAVDLMIATDPAAPAQRRAPAAGDKRLLVTFVKDQLRALLYEPVAPGADATQRWEAISPVHRVKFDRVVEAPWVRADHKADARGYKVELAIPLDKLGVTLRPDSRVKLDWGVITTDDAGNAVLQRRYWSNQATAVTADLPTESELHPEQWGYALISGEAGRGAAPDPTLKPGKAAPGGESFREFLKELEP